MKRPERIPELAQNDRGQESLRQTERAPAVVSDRSHAEVTASVKELARLAQEQGFLTYEQIQATWRGRAIEPDELSEVCARLMELEIEIVRQAGIEGVRGHEAAG